MLDHVVDEPVVNLPIHVDEEVPELRHLLKATGEIGLKNPRFLQDAETLGVLLRDSLSRPVAATVGVAGGGRSASA